MEEKEERAGQNKIDKDAYTTAQNNDATVAGVGIPGENI